MPVLSLAAGAGAQVSAASATPTGNTAELARVEFVAKQTRISESRVLDEIMGRLGRIESTTQDLRGLIEAMPIPVAGHSAPAPTQATAPVPAMARAPACPPPTPTVRDQSDDDTEETDSAPHLTLSMPQLAGASLTLLALVAWLLRRRSAPAQKNTVSKPANRKASKEETPLRSASQDADSVPSWVPDISHVGHADGVAAGQAGPRPNGALHATPPATPSPSFSALPTAAGLNGRPGTVAVNGAAGVDDGFDPTLELAEIMLSMGMASSAAQALEEHIRENPREALLHWLKLLDVYRKDGHRSDFEKAASQLQKSFNIRASDWLKVTDEIKTLEDFPRVIKEVITLWPQPQECVSYLYHLLEDNREGMRLGFPQSAAEDILLLINILKAVHHIEIPPQAGHPEPADESTTASEAAQ